MPISSFSRLLHATVCAGVSAVMFLAPATAKADTLTNFTLNATLENSGSESGNLTLDRTTNLFMPGNITVISDGITYTLRLSHQLEDSGTYFIGFTDTSGAYADLDIPAVSTLAGYQGGQVASETFYSALEAGFYPGPSVGGLVLVQSGTLEPFAAPTAVTPEPSSLLLLGTGALGMAGALRRRFFPRA